MSSAKSAQHDPSVTVSRRTTTAPRVTPKFQRARQFGAVHCSVALGSAECVRSPKEQFEFEPFFRRQHPPFPRAKRVKSSGRRSTPPLDTFASCTRHFACRFERPQRPHKKKAAARGNARGRYGIRKLREAPTGREGKKVPWRLDLANCIARARPPRRLIFWLSNAREPRFLAFVKQNLWRSDHGV